MRLKPFLLCLLLLVAGCSDYPPPEPAPDPAWEANLTLGYLRMLWHGRLFSMPEEAVVIGRVVSSDEEGNFYRTIVIDDGTGALEVLAGLYDLHTLYRPGERVAVRLRGLAIGRRDGVMQVGLRPASWSGDPWPDYMEHRVVVDRYVACFEGAEEPVAPLRMRIGALDEALCGRLVRIDGLLSDRPLDAWAPDARTGYPLFRDERGDSLAVAVSPYARFALRPIPAGSVSVVGVLRYGKVGSKSCYQVKIRSLDDVLPAGAGNASSGGVPPVRSSNGVER